MLFTQIFTHFSRFAEKVRCDSSVNIVESEEIKPLAKAYADEAATLGQAVYDLHIYSEQADANGAKEAAEQMRNTLINYFWKPIHRLHQDLVIFMTDRSKSEADKGSGSVAYNLLNFLHDLWSELFMHGRESKFKEQTTLSSFLTTNSQLEVAYQGMRSMIDFHRAIAAKAITTT